jgi:hypothetical protein
MKLLEPYLQTVIDHNLFQVNITPNSIEWDNHHCYYFSFYNLVPLENLYNDGEASLPPSDDGTFTIQVELSTNYLVAFVVDSELRWELSNLGDFKDMLSEFSVITQQMEPDTPDRSPLELWLFDSSNDNNKNPYLWGQLSLMAGDIDDTEDAILWLDACHQAASLALDEYIYLKNMEQGKPRAS